MKFQKLCSALLVLCLMVVLASTTVSVRATEIAGGECGKNLTWTLDSNGTLTISGTGAMAYNSMAAVPWQDYMDQIVSLVIEEGATDIFEDGFADCTGLVSVSLPNTLEKIGNCAFFGCAGLKEIVLPESLKTIDSNAFYGCTGLKEVKLPASVTGLGATPFAQCTSLTAIRVDESNRSFTNDKYGVLFTKDMTSLLEAPCGLKGAYTIPQSVGEICWGAFFGCTGVTSVTIPEGIDWIDMEVFAGCFALEQVVIPESVEMICSGAFVNCTALKEITIPAAVYAIDPGAFQNCRSLSKIYFMGDAPETAGAVFAGVTATAYYSSANQGWTKEARDQIGERGSITWVDRETPGETTPATEPTEPVTAPTEPEPTQPLTQPTQPKETQPNPTEPQPTETKPAESVPTESTAPGTVPDETTVDTLPPEATDSTTATVPDSTDAALQTEDSAAETTVPVDAQEKADPGKGSDGKIVLICVALAVLAAGAGVCVYFIVKILRKKS